MHRLGWLVRVGLAELVIVSSLVLSTIPATAATPHNACVFAPTRQQCTCQAVRPPGQGSEPRPKPPTSPESCSWQGRAYPCNDPTLGWFDNQDGCYYRPESPQPVFD